MDHVFELPAIVFLDLAKFSGGVFEPISRSWEAICRDILGAYLPKVLELVDNVKLEKSPHADSLALMNPFDVVLIMLGYLVMIAVSSAIMSKAKEPFKLKAFALFHNFFLTLLSGYMMAEILRQAYKGGYTFWGNNYDSSEKGLPMARIIWVFYVSKIIEFLDTLIMALKKNFRQISFLHVYHHLTIFGIWWLVTMTAPGGEAYYSAALNSMVHVVMYGYYFFSAMGVKQVLFIKRYITMMQMTQFITNMMQASYDLWTGGGGYPNFPTRILFFYMITLLALFLNYFINDAARTKEKKEKLLKENGNGKHAEPAAAAQKKSKKND